MENLKWESDQTPVNYSALFLDYARGHHDGHPARMDICANSGCIPSIGATIWEGFGNNDILIVYGRMPEEELNLYCEKSGTFFKCLLTYIAIKSKCNPELTKTMVTDSSIIYSF